MSRYNIGVDIGGTTVKIGVFDRDMAANKILMKKAIPTRTENGGVHILPDIAEAVALMLEECGAGMDDVEKIGVGVPGPVVRDRESGDMLVNGCVNLGWSELVDISAELGELTGVSDISVTNDANAAALGEVIAGSCRDKTVAVITIGTGIGGGIVQSGEIMEGAFGAAGEVGHMKIQPQHEMIKTLARRQPADEGKAGEGAADAVDAGDSEGAGAQAGLEIFKDLEYYTSAVGIARVAKAALDLLPDESVMREAEAVDAKCVMDAAKAGDKLALKVTDFFFDTLGYGLATIASVIDPDMFIIGGGVAGAGQFLSDGLQAGYRKYVFHASRDTEFRLAVLGNDAGMIGAACCGD
ncbi:MAG: ROK family protein [Eubacterium sp.]|nr:ROK family protein [Eubacterium sp.]